MCIYMKVLLYSLKFSYYFKIKKCLDSFLSRSISGIYYVIHSDDVFLWEREEDREGNWYYFQRDVAFTVFPSRKSLFDFSDSGRLCHFPN